MTLNAALWASSTALTGKAALAFWTAAFLFQCFDHRKSAATWQILLSVGVIVGCVFGSMHASSPLTHWIWIASGLIASLSTIVNIRLWTSTSPREAYEEASQIDATSKKKSGSKPALAKTPKKKPSSSVQWIDLLGLLTTSAALALSVYESVSSPRSHAWISTIHAIAACCLWGVGIFCAIQLTFSSAPSSLSAVSWSRVAMLALGCWIAESCIAASLILSPVESNEDFQAVAMTRLFAISILLMDFVVWMIPHRVTTFQRSGKATAWVSLTMAAWIGMISLAVLCALPSAWPWQS